MGAHHASALIAVALLVACGDDDARTPASPDASAGETSTSGAGWISRRSLPAPQQETAVLELGGKIYVLGGFALDGRAIADVNVYDPSNDTWTAGRPLPEPIHHVNATVIGERIWVTGGLGGGDFGPTGVVWSFDAASNEWTAKTPMPAGTERGASAVAAVGDHVYVAGGLRNGTVADVSRYDTNTDIWESLPPLAVARDHGAGAANGGLFYVIAGRNSALVPSVAVFDPQQKTWSERATLPTGRAGFALAIRDGRAYVIGGEGNPAAGTDGVFAEVEAYDFASDTWTKLAPMKTPRHGMGAATTGAQILVPGGGVKAGLAATDIVEALTF